MENSKEHHEIMTRLAVFEATVNGKFDSVINHLAQLNGQTSKNAGQIENLQEQDRQLTSLINNQLIQDKTLSDRQEMREVREESMKKRWVDLLFGSLQYFIPILVTALFFSLLFNGQAIAQFFGIER
jgi:hypothetical protein